MRPVVIYSEDLEPITVVDLPERMFDRLRDGDRIRLACQEPFRLDQQQAMLRTVEIYGEVLQRRGHQTLMVFANSDELALATRSSLLPGQRADALRRERGAFMLGAISAMIQKGG